MTPGQKAEQLRLVKAMARNMRMNELDPCPENARAVELGSKALYSFHAVIILAPKPKAARRTKA